MGIITPLGDSWDAIAAVQSALEELEPGDGVLVLMERRGRCEDDPRAYRSANLTKAEAVWLLEINKIDILME